MVISLVKGWFLYLQMHLTVLILVFSDLESGTSDETLQGRLEALDQSFTFPRSALAVQLSTARVGLSYCPEARAFLQANGPLKERHSTRYQVFKDLRERGFYLTSAGKFGGDFLVYPGQQSEIVNMTPQQSVRSVHYCLSSSGDPLRFHAHFIAVCLPADKSICLLDVLAVARLGSNVKKTVLFCSPGQEGEVLYTSLQWSGMV